MRLLMKNEIDEVNGAGILPTEIDEGLKILKQTRSVLGNLAWALGTGIAIGTAISKGYEAVMGDSIGGDIYDLFHC